jgi:hypothetical protein
VLRVSLGVLFEFEVMKFHLKLRWRDGNVLCVIYRPRATALVQSKDLPYARHLLDDREMLMLPPRGGVRSCQAMTSLASLVNP